MNNKKINIWNCIKEFVFRFFRKQKYIMLTENEVQNKYDELKDNLKQQYDDNERKKQLYEMLLSGEIDSTDLTDEDVEELIVFVKNDISQKNHEIQRIKNKIIKIKENLN